MLSPPIEKPAAPGARGRAPSRKCECGAPAKSGGACAACGERKLRLQPKLAVGAANDPLEAEADRIADSVLGGRGADFGAVPIAAQRRGAASAPAAAEAPASVHRALAGPGRPLDPALRRDLEPRFGRDFSQVRIHDGPAAGESARAVGAVAYTVASDIVFASGRYAPASSAGRRLLAHELAHVAQQEGGAKLRRQTPVPPNEMSKGFDFNPHKLPKDEKPNVAETPAGTCGPEVKQWLVEQVAKSVADERFVNIKEKFAAAEQIAARYGAKATEAVEGGATALIEWKELRARTEIEGDRPSDDLLAGAKAGLNFAGSIAPAVLLDPLLPIVLSPGPMDVVMLVKDAVDAWKGLVGHEAVFDFKANVMKAPQAAGCATPSCTGTVTLCGGGPQKQNCYLNDLPGNLFYALIGKYVGLSNLALRLGSQYAQLTSEYNPSWDPPKDIAAINLGYSLPVSLSVADLCAAVPPARNSLTARADCADCDLPTTAPLQ